MKNTPMLLLIRGLPGSGKSTRAKSLIQSGAMDIHLEADQFFTDSYGVYQFNAALIRNAHAWCQEETEKALRQGKRVVVSNTFTQMWEIKPYADMSARLDLSFGVIECDGKWVNVHNVPSHQLDRMRARWEPFNMRGLIYAAT